MKNKSRMKNVCKMIVGTAIVLGAAGVGFAQGTAEIPEHEIMWKKEYTRVLDLREKQNSSWMSNGHEISKYLIDGVLNGKLTAYTSDSLTNTMSIEKFVTKMTIPGMEEEEVDTEWETEDDWPTEDDDSDIWDQDVQLPSPSPMYLPKQMYILELTEDAIYSRKESRMRYDVKTISLYIPADNPDNLKGVQELVATFKYEDCVKYFNDLNEWVWFNPSNTREHKDFENAMDLRLFASTIVKVSNPDDLYIEDIEGSPEKGIIGSYNEMMNLMIKEHEMYEF